MLVYPLQDWFAGLREKLARQVIFLRPKFHRRNLVIPPVTALIKAWIVVRSIEFYHSGARVRKSSAAFFESRHAMSPALIALRLNNLGNATLTRMPTGYGKLPVCCVAAFCDLRDFSGACSDEFSSESFYNSPSNSDKNASNAPLNRAHSSVKVLKRWLILSKGIFFIVQTLRIVCSSIRALKCR